MEDKNGFYFYIELHQILATKDESFEEGSQAAKDWQPSDLVTALYNVEEPKASKTGVAYKNASVNNRSDVKVISIKDQNGNTFPTINDKTAAGIYTVVLGYQLNESTDPAMLITKSATVTITRKPIPKNGQNISSTWTITYTDDKGKVLHQPTTETTTFIRTPDMVDSDGKVVKSGSWNESSYKYGNVIIPVINGYVAQHNSKIVLGWKATPTDANYMTTIVYKKVGRIIPVDKDGQPISDIKPVPYQNDLTDATKVLATPVPTGNDDYSIDEKQSTPGFNSEKNTVTPVDPTLDTKVYYNPAQPQPKPEDKDGGSNADNNSSGTNTTGNGNRNTGFDQGTAPAVLPTLPPTKNNSRQQKKNTGKRNKQPTRKNKKRQILMAKRSKLASKLRLRQKKTNLPSTNGRVKLAATGHGVTVTNRSQMKNNHLASFQSNFGSTKRAVRKRKLASTASLPKTGSENISLLAKIGLAFTALAGLVGLAGVDKRKHN